MTSYHLIALLALVVLTSVHVNGAADGTPNDVPTDGAPAEVQIESTPVAVQPEEISKQLLETIENPVGSDPDPENFIQPQFDFEEEPDQEPMPTSGANQDESKQTARFFGGQSLFSAGRPYGRPPPYYNPYPPYGYYDYIYQYGGYPPFGFGK